nr:NAD(+) kinase [uncultured Campylobacter sp.]
MENKIHKNLKFAGLIAKKSEEIRPVVEQICEILKAQGIELLLEEDGAEFFGLKPHTLAEILKKTNFLISLGGDGTLIGLARLLSDKNAFILGINAGTLGFLTDVQPSEFAKFLKEFLRGEYEIERPFLLEVILENGSGKIVRKTAFNDVVITRSHISSMAKIDAFLNRKYFNTYYGDGVIVSSAVGSTAYNMSANGSIVYPLCDVFCVTPICSHSLTQRPLILPKEYLVSFKNAGNSEVSVVIDGQDVFDMAEFHSVSVKISHAKANLIKRRNYDYFDVLKAKLRWGHGGC